MLEKFHKDVICFFTKEWTVGELLFHHKKQLQLNRSKSCLHNGGNLFPPVADPFLRPGAGLAQGLEQVQGTRSSKIIPWSSATRSGNIKHGYYPLTSPGMILQSIPNMFNISRYVSGSLREVFLLLWQGDCLKGLPWVKNATATHM